MPLPRGRAESHACCSFFSAEGGVHRRRLEREGATTAFRDWEAVGVSSSGFSAGARSVWQPLKCPKSGTGAVRSLATKRALGAGPCTHFGAESVLRSHIRPNLELGPTLANIGPNSADPGRLGSRKLPTFGQLWRRPPTWATPAQHRPKSARNWQMLVEVGPNLVEIGPTLTNSCRSLSKCAHTFLFSNFDRSWPEVGQDLPELVRFRPTLTKLDNIGLLGANSAQAWPNSGSISPGTGGFGPNSTTKSAQRRPILTRNPTKWWCDDCGRDCRELC